MPVYDVSLQKGVVIDSVICKAAPAQSYALYLPTYYDPIRSFPCIYFFDAHARGALPVTAYKDLAERYGFVLVGSDVSKNGTPWPATDEGVKAMMADVRTRLNTDPKRIYTAGFSGGSRVASSVALLDGGVTGVIGCAAGFPSVEGGIERKFWYFGVVGDHDFNLAEMQQLDQQLAQNNFRHQLLTARGIHGWPSVADFETALLWILVNEMNDKITAENDTLIGHLKSDLEKRIAAARSAGDLIKAGELLSGSIRVLDGQAEVVGYKKQLDELEASAAYKADAALSLQLQRTEQEQQRQLAGEFTSEDEQWCAKKISELNQNAKLARTHLESDMYSRLVNYLGLVGYLSSRHALSTGDLPHALSYIKVFKMADPKNPDCAYLAAVYYMEKGDKAQAMSSLREAAALGYSEVITLLADPAFSGMSGDASFNSIVNSVRKNSVFGH